MSDEQTQAEVERLRAENEGLRAELAGHRDVVRELQLRRDLTKLALDAGGDPRVLVPVATSAANGARVALDENGKLIVADLEGNVLQGVTAASVVKRLAELHPVSPQAPAPAAPVQVGSYEHRDQTIAKIAQGFTGDVQKGTEYRQRLAERKGQPSAPAPAAPPATPPRKPDVPVQSAEDYREQYRSKIAQGLKG